MRREDIRELLHEIARPRLTGTAGAQEVAAIVRQRFNSYGYQIRDFPFSFSTWPGRFGVSVAGAVFVAGTLGAATLMNMRHAGVALAVLLTVLLLTGALATLAPLLTQMLPVGRVHTANLFAFKPGSRPRFIVMAHLDSKSQSIPLSFRGPAILVAIISWSAFVMLAMLGMLDPIWIIRWLTTLIGVLCYIAGVLLIFCFVENRSPGALDNASGLSTLIGVAASDRDHDDVAYLITDAEELGLVGSRAIARQLQPVIGVINIDGIDDEGGFYILERFGIPPRHIAPHLAAAIMTAATEMGEPAQRRTVPFGLLLDHMPLARVQLPAVTLMRGSMRSLLRVHLPTDSLAALNGVGIDSAIALVRRSLEILRGGAPAGSV
jgi:hypothetical protein